MMDPEAKRINQGRLPVGIERTVGGWLADVFATSRLVGGARVEAKTGDGRKVRGEIVRRSVIGGTVTIVTETGIPTQCTYRRVPEVVRSSLAKRV